MFLRFLCRCLLSALFFHRHGESTQKKRRGARFQAFCRGASFLMLRRDPTPSIFLIPLSWSVHRASHLGLMGTLGLNVPSFPSFPLFLSFQNRCHVKDLFSQFLSFSKEFPGIPSVPWVPFLQGSKERERRKRNLVPRHRMSQCVGHMQLCPPWCFVWH